MNIGIVLEERKSESRISIIPETILKFENHKFSIVKDAGIKSGFYNEEYENSGARIVENNKKLISENDLIISVNALDSDYYKYFLQKSILISNFETFTNTNSIKNLIENNISRRVLIQMNEPLRHRGYTFYQASFIEEEDKQTSVLATVKNYGRMFPYISSIIMVFGFVFI